MVYGEVMRMSASTIRHEGYSRRAGALRYERISRLLRSIPCRRRAVGPTGLCETSKDAVEAGVTGATLHRCFVPACRSDCRIPEISYPGQKMNRLRLLVAAGRTSRRRAVPCRRASLLYQYFTRHSTFMPRGYSAILRFDIDLEYGMRLTRTRIAGKMSEARRDCPRWSNGTPFAAAPNGVITSTLPKCVRRPFVICRNQISPEIDDIEEVPRLYG